MKSHKKNPSGMMLFSFCVECDIISAEFSEISREYMSTNEIIYRILAAAALYYACPLKFRWILLLVYSFALYAMGGNQALLYILTTILSTYLAAYAMESMSMRMKATLAEKKTLWSKDEVKEHKAANKKKRRIVLFVTLLLNFGMLCVLKYVPNLPGKIIGGVFSLTGHNAPSVRLFVPLGISFFIFQSAGYLIDVYNGKYPAEKNLFRYALFVSFFPQLIQGPINRFDKLASQLTTPHRLDIVNIRSGLMLMMWGFFKKKVIADTAFPLVNAVFENHTPYGGAVIICAVLMYSLQQYADFSGGIDLVTGGAELMGIHLAPNFKRPYFSVSLGDFWRRWHISLGSWMRDYVFYPFALTRPMQKLTKAAKKTLGNDTARALPAALGNILVFTLVGLWHGATDHYIAWGFYNGLILAFSALMEPVYKRFGEKNEDLVSSRPFYVFRILRTFIIVNIGWYFDRALCFSDSIQMLGKTVLNPRFTQLTDGTLLSLGISAGGYAVLASATVFLLAVSVMQEKGIHVRIWLMERPLAVRWLILYVFMCYTMFFFSSGETVGFLYAAF